MSLAVGIAVGTRMVTISTATIIETMITKCQSFGGLGCNKIHKNYTELLERVVAGMNGPERF